MLASACALAQASLRGRKVSADKIEIHGVTDAMVWEAARAMEGFSGREIAKYMAAVQAAVYGSHEPVLTPEIWQSVLKRKLYEHEERAAFKLGHHGTGSSTSTRMLEEQLKATIKPKVVDVKPKESKQ